MEIVVGVSSFFTIISIVFASTNPLNFLLPVQEQTKYPLFDKFGIMELYPTKPGGSEWFVNMTHPTSDPLFRNLNNLQFTKQQDGSWQVNASNGQVRMEAWSPPGKKWLNVEITEYAKLVNSSRELLQMYSRGGRHTYSDPCIGSAYKARLYGNGTASWTKEVTFPAYTEDRGVKQVTMNTPLQGRWIGFKAIIFNVEQNGSKYVHLESYIDSNVTDSKGGLIIKNNWTLASVYYDNGGWATENIDFDPSCGRSSDAILFDSGGTSMQNIAAWRTDNTIWNFKYLSVREIQSPLIVENSTARNSAN